MSMQQERPNKRKKVKVEYATVKQEDDDEYDDDANNDSIKKEEEEDEADEKKEEVASSGVKAVVHVKKTNENNEAYFELSKTRRLTVRQFKKTTLIDIREYYEKGDQMLPGKKGISLTVDQYQQLCEMVSSGEIDQAIRVLDE